MTVGGSLRWVGLIAVAALCGGLAVFQWMELVLLDAGLVAVCSIDDVFNCGAVWEAPWATDIRDGTGLPVAGWGLLWALMALGFALWATSVRLRARPLGASGVAVSLMAVGGVVACVVLGAYSASLGQVCLTCLATYVLVAAYAGLAWSLRSDGFGLGASTHDLRSAMLAVSIGTMVGFGVLRFAVSIGATTDETAAGSAQAGAFDGNGTETTAASTPPLSLASNGKEPPAEAPTSGGNIVAEYIRALAPAVRRRVAEGLSAYKLEPKPALPPISARPFVGTDSAPVKIVDFSDMKCAHCARLASNLSEVKKQAPADLFRIESRLFPLDAACNPALPPNARHRTDVRCAAAKTLICAQDSPKYEALRMRMFESQAGLTVDGVASMAQRMLNRSAGALSDCVRSPQTAQKLREDIAYATRFNIRGTPMVVLNGRKTLAYGPLILALILAEGDPNHSGFTALEN